MNYLVCLEAGRVEGKFREAGEIIGKHADLFDARLRASRLSAKLRSHRRDAIWPVASDESHRVGDVSETLLQAGHIARRDHHCLNAMLEVLAQDGGTATEHSQGIVATILLQEGLSIEDLRSQYTDRAKAELDRRTKLQLDNAAYEASRAAVFATLDRDRDLNTISYTFPAVRGIQAGKAYFAAQVPYNLIPKLFVFEEDVVPPECRAQRTLNESRAVAIADYVLENPTDYVLPALTCSVSAEMSFETIGGSNQLGLLHIPVDATMLINDGQHRRRGIELALKERPKLAAETISVAIFYDEGLRRAQQMFADINGKMVRPSTAISALYDQRNPFNPWILEILEGVPDIRSRIDFESTSVGAKSSKLWSLVAFKKFVTLLTGVNEGNFDQLAPAGERRQGLAALVQSFLREVRAHVPDWASMVDGQIAPSEARKDLVIAQAVWLHGLGVMGRHVLMERGTPSGLDRLRLVATSKSSPMWQGRCVSLGKMVVSADGVNSTAAKLLQLVGARVPVELSKLDQLITSRQAA